MMTQTEQNKLLQQINNAFEEDRKRLNKLEERISELMASLKSPEKQVKAAKGASE